VTLSESLPVLQPERSRRLIVIKTTFLNNKKITCQPYFDKIIDSLKYCIASKSLRLYSYVMLENHLHLIVSAPLLSDTITSFKKYTAKKIIDQLKVDKRDWLLNQLKYYKKRHKTQSTYQVWQEGVLPKQIISMEMLRQKVEYIHHNPITRRYVDLPEHWHYSSARNYMHDDHSVIEVDTYLF
jgi:REP element-mobilizing transposase RayT